MPRPDTSGNGSTGADDDAPDAALDDAVRARGRAAQWQHGSSTTYTSRLRAPPEPLERCARVVVAGGWSIPRRSRRRRARRPRNHGFGRCARRSSRHVQRVPQSPPVVHRRSSTAEDLQEVLRAADGMVDGGEAQVRHVIEGLSSGAPSPPRSAGWRVAVGRLASLRSTACQTSPSLLVGPGRFPAREGASRRGVFAAEHLAAAIGFTRVGSRNSTRSKS